MTGPPRRVLSVAYVPTAVEPFYVELGLRIQGFRKRANMTQAELGRLLEARMTRASVANIEGAKQRVLAHTLAEIASALGVSLDQLVATPPRPPRSAGGVEVELARKLSISQVRARKMAAEIGFGAARRAR